MQHTAKSSENSIVSQNSSLELGALLSLTHPANYWAHICPYCSKDFPSSYALGGHQNAHRRERMEEKRLYIKDPLSYRKRAYLRSLRSLKLVHNGPKASLSGGPELSGVLHANGVEESGYVVSPVAGVLDFPCRSGHACGSSNCHPYPKPRYLKPMPSIDLNLFLGSELISVDKYCEATVLAAKGRALSGGSGITQRLDLTLKL